MDNFIYRKTKADQFAWQKFLEFRIVDVVLSSALCVLFIFIIFNFFSSIFGSFIFIWLDFDSFETTRAYCKMNIQQSMISNLKNWIDFVLAASSNLNYLRFKKRPKLSRNGDLCANRKSFHFFVSIFEQFEGFPLSDCIII